MSTPDAQRDSIEVGGFPTEARPVDRESRHLPAGLYVLSLLIAGVAILAAFLAIIAAGSGLSKFAVTSSWVFIVAAGLWAGGTIYILSMNIKRLWERLRSTSNGQPTS